MKIILCCIGIHNWGYSGWSNDFANGYRVHVNCCRRCKTERIQCFKVKDGEEIKPNHFLIKLFFKIPIRIAFTWRSAKQPMGRFGGGWQWHIGIEANSCFSDIIIFLLFCYIRIYCRSKD